MNFEHLAFLFNCDFSNRGQARLDFDEAAGLFGHVRALGADAEGVEIGRYHGGSTLLLAAALGIHGTLLSIDPAPRNDEALAGQLRECGLSERVTLSNFSSNTYSLVPNQQFDFVFVDGDHSYQQAKRDHMKWGVRLKAGGLVIHHDMAKARPNATQIPDLARLRGEILEHQGSCVELVEEVGSLSVFRRRGGCWRSWG